MAYRPPSILSRHQSYPSRLCYLFISNKAPPECFAQAPDRDGDLGRACLELGFLLGRAGLWEPVGAEQREVERKVLANLAGYDLNRVSWEIKIVGTYCSWVLQCSGLESANAPQHQLNTFITLMNFQAGNRVSDFMHASMHVSMHVIAQRLPSRVRQSAVRTAQFQAIASNVIANVGTTIGHSLKPRREATCPVEVGGQQRVEQDVERQHYKHRGHTEGGVGRRRYGDAQAAPMQAARAALHL